MWTEKGWGLEERATKGQWETWEASQQVHVSLVWAPHGMDHSQACRLPPRQTAQGRTEEEVPEGQLCHLCCCCCYSSKPSICHPHGLDSQPGRMMVHASMDVGIYNVSIHGWANNGFRTTNCLPAAFHDTISSEIPLPSCLPDWPHTLEDDIKCICPREILALAASRETNSFHPQVPTQKDEPRHQVLDRSEQRQSNALDLPCPNRGFHI